MEGKEKNRILNKRVAVFYQDGVNHVSRKDGLLTDSTELDVVLDTWIIIPRARIIRIEVQR